MGAWDVGPFENDSAADFCNELDDLSEHDRPAAIREALRFAVQEAGYLDVDDGSAAVAAAAIVAAQSPGGQPIGSAYGPEQPVPALPHDLRPLAVQALDRVTAENSELAGLWGEGEGEGNEWAGKWKEEIRRLREVLAAASA
ncbi:DUF4259 domain-containing protein [Actinomadura fulvescens]|uniref:DUF4259 domain-containing protein n=1 Tax=Actinomadura fulvescens TaxID=46160 RepID=A0ABN3QQ10_9ACTN